ncbi:MAG: DUF2993 domain-containing protein [bacterium]
MNKFRSPFFSLLLLAFLMTASVDSFVEGGIEKLLEEKLPSVIGPAKSYRLKFADTSLLDLAGGRINKLTIEARDYSLPDAPLIEYFLVEMSGMRFDLEAIRAVQKTTFRMMVGEDALNDYLKKKNIIDPVPVLSIRRGELGVSMRKEFLGIKIGAVLRGNLQVVEDHEVLFRPSGLEVAGIGIPKPIAQMLVDRVNPLVDLKKMNLPVKSITIEEAEHRFIIKGEAALPLPITLRKK